MALVRGGDAYSEPLIAEIPENLFMFIGRSNILVRISLLHGHVYASPALSPQTRLKYHIAERYFGCMGRRGSSIPFFEECHPLPNQRATG